MKGISDMTNDDRQYFIDLNNDRQKAIECLKTCSQQWHKLGLRTNACAIALYEMLYGALLQVGMSDEKIISIFEDMKEELKAEREKNGF